MDLPAMFGSLVILYGLLVFVFIVLFPLLTIIHCVRMNLTVSSKLLWILLILFIPGFGPLGYMVGTTAGLLNTKR